MKATHRLDVVRRGALTPRTVRPALTGAGLQRLARRPDRAVEVPLPDAAGFVVPYGIPELPFASCHLSVGDGSSPPAVAGLARRRDLAEGHGDARPNTLAGQRG